MITPSFSLDFTAASLDSRVTFSRTGNTATVTDSSGNIAAINANLPRFDFDPITLACRGLLIEENRTNLLPYSEAVNSWTKTNSTVASDAAISPSGIQNADKIITNNGASNGQASVSVSKTASAITYTYSIFAKAGEWNRVGLYLSDSGSFANRADFLVNLSDGSVFSSATARGTFTNASGTVKNAGNGWYRVTLTFTSGVETAILYRVYSLDSSATTGNGSSGIYVWGGQLEAAASATSYIPNLSTSTTTRNADVATITGTNFSDWWQAGLGGATVQALPSTVSGVRPLIQFDDGTANEIIALRGNTTNPELYIVDGGTPQAQIDAGTIAANTAYSLTGWWATNDCKARKDSGAVVTDTTATIPTVTQARLGSDGTNYLNGHLASINYYDQFSGQIYTRRKNKAVFTVI